MRSPAGATPIRPLHPGRPERNGRTARTDLAGLAGFAPLGDGPLGRAGRAARLGLLATLATLPALAAASATTLATLPALAAASATTLPRAAPGSAAAPAPPAIPIGCCSLAGTTTRLELDGFVQVYGAYFHEQSLNDNGALLAFDHALDLRATPGRQFTATARTTRLGLSAITPTASLGDVLARIEIDFADGKGFGGKPHLRHAYLGFGNWIAGHTWSVWTDPDAAGETVDNCGAVGQACFDTGRYTQLRYTVPMGHGSRLAVSVEKNVTTHGVFPDQSLTRPASPAGTIPDGRYPSLVAAYTMDGDWGHLSLRGLEQHYGAYTPGTAATDQLRTRPWARTASAGRRCSTTSRPDRCSCPATAAGRPATPATGARGSAPTWWPAASISRTTARAPPASRTPTATSSTLSPSWRPTWRRVWNTATKICRPSAKRSPAGTAP